MTIQNENERAIRQLQALANEPLAGDSERNIELLCNIPLDIFYDDAHRPMTYGEYVNYWCKHATIALVKRTKTYITMCVIAPASELLRLIDRTHGIVARQVIDILTMDNETEFE